MNELQKSNNNSNTIAELKKYFGFGIDGNPVTDNAIELLKYVMDKYNVDPFLNEVSILYNKPYVQYKGLMKILIENNIDFKIDFEIISDTDKEIIIYCYLLIVPKYYKNRAAYYKEMNEAGVSYEQAKKEITTKGYSKILKADLKANFRKFYITMCKKQAFKDAFNFSSISSEIGSSIPVDFDEEINIIETVTKQPEIVDETPKQANDKNKPLDEEEAKVERRKVIGALRQSLIKDQNIANMLSEGLTQELFRDKKTEQNERKAFDVAIAKAIHLTSKIRYANIMWKEFYFTRTENGIANEDFIFEIENIYTNFKNISNTEADVSKNENTDENKSSGEINGSYKALTDTVKMVAPQFSEEVKTLSKSETYLKSLIKKLTGFDATEKEVSEFEKEEISNIVNKFIENDKHAAFKKIVIDFTTAFKTEYKKVWSECVKNS